MISLGDYFQPLLPFNIIYYVLLFVFFDVLGTYIRKKLIDESETYRIINWLLGFGIFIFFWFLVSQVIAYTDTAIFISIGLLLLVSLPNYLKYKEYLKLLKELWSLKLPILVILPLLPSVFIKASLPPYYGDEMAYHFISPSTLNTIAPIKYLGGLYADFPRTMNLFWELIFSLTKSYSAARLFHFTILTTSMLFTFSALKKNYSALVGFMFVFIFFSLPQDIVTTSTLGYIDVAAYSFLLIGLMFAVDFLLNKNKEALILSSIFWAMNLGTKYTGLSAFISFLTVFVLIIVVKRKEYLPLITRGLFFRIISFGVVFGGYWYIKNLIHYGNPIFPFIFPCFKEFAVSCSTGGSFFGDWTTQVTRANLFPIISQLFSTNRFLQIFILCTPFFAFFVKDKKVRLMGVFLIAPAVIELLILKNFSGFYARYHQHMQLYLLAALVVLLANKESVKERFTKAIIAILIVSSLFTYLHTIKYSNSLGFLNWYEIKYALNKISIYDWIDWKFPEMKPTLEWCENPPDGPNAPLARFDPDLIWFEPTGQMRVFMTNCVYKNPALEGLELDEVIPRAKAEKMTFYIASPFRCVANDAEVKPKFEYEQDYQFVFRKLNNKIICNSTEIRPNLYYFDYTTIK